MVFTDSRSRVRKGEMMIRLGILILAAFGLSAPVIAQTQSEQDRIDQLARYSVIATSCKNFGARFSDDLPKKTLALVHEEGSSWSISQDKLTEAFTNSAKLQVRLFDTDHEIAMSSLEKVEGLKSSRAYLTKFALLCDAAAKDHSFGRIFSLPSDFSPIAAANALADEALAEGGLASWQTKEIVNRGDLLNVAGICRKLIGPIRSDALRTRYGSSDIPRERAYYTHSFEAGLEDKNTTVSLASCNRAIAHFEAMLAH